MKINNQHEFLDYMLKQHWDDHPADLIDYMEDIIIKRDVSVIGSDFKSFIYYYCYYGEIDAPQVKRLHKELEKQKAEPQDEVRGVIVWCKNKDSNGILFCSYQNFIDGLKAGEHVDYSVFRWGDPTDDSTPIGGKRT